VGDTSVCVFLLVYPCGIVVSFVCPFVVLNNERAIVCFPSVYSNTCDCRAFITLLPATYRISRQCTYIPKEISELYTRLKLSKGVTRGKKKYWVTSAIQRGLCNGENGIVFSSSVGTAES
jgi:hypothetical protein